MGEGGRAGTVIALPGWKGTDLGLRGLLRNTVEAGFGVIVVNPPGNGVSPSAPARVETLAELTEVILETLETLPEIQNSAVLLGHSFGATVAISLAAKRPPWLHGLALVSPVVRAQASQSGIRGRLAQLVVDASGSLLRDCPRVVADAYIRSRLVEYATNLLYARSKFNGARQIIMRSNIEHGLCADPRSVGDHLRMAGGHGCIDFAAHVRCPVEILAGNSDPMSSVAELELLRSQIAEARLTVVTGAGHLAHHENAKQFSKLTADCVSALMSAAGSP
ncbi:alpha/beta fold hydrolase [Mycobacterium aquaticum]|nr:alpha/beta hydrolase [Mycobacterium aquaticum]